MKKKDMIGQRFGRLIVIEALEERKNNRIMYKCKCDCGNETITRGDRLRRGETKSCGCLVRELGVEKAKRMREFITTPSIEHLQKMHNARRKHFGCMHCGSDKHYAKGLCRSCYNKLRKGTLE